MSYTVATIHAFTDGAALKGNPAGVCLLEAFPDDTALQEIARRIGHAETAFLVKQDANSFALRWFTPTTEVPLCGHATLAAAHYLRETQQVDGIAPIHFNTQSGMLDAHFDKAAIRLTLPATPGQDVAPNMLAHCIGVPILACQHSGRTYLVEVADMEALRNCQPNLAAIAKLDSEDLIVTTAGENGYDYAYRCFCPQVGIDEDPVTGSANCTLAPYWAAKLGRTSMKALQASANGGALEITLNGATVDIAGRALTINHREIDLNRPQIARAS